ncbi:hypothetical protein Pdw03_4704 [Penicillium digitatum]|uniref:Uncharacterized protein n=1 Tax=Penicillium digitatum TaxID=36651 RepID=A0A7T6XIQ5_PENDI|nr:hypothetical protein Pdw03_4704 [Penicillium digitatum]
MFLPTSFNFITHTPNTLTLEIIISINFIKVPALIQLHSISLPTFPDSSLPEALNQSLQIQTSPKARPQLIRKT